MNFFQYFVNPWALIGLIAVPILILIYIIKKRYREEVVPSTFLWKRSLKYMKKRLPFNFKNLLLLLLQISAVTLAVLVIARPTIPSKKTGETIVILDTSASMRTTVYVQDGNETKEITRLDRAKDMIAEYAKEVDRNNRMTLITAGDTVERRLYRSEKRYNIISELDKIECGWGAANTDFNETIKGVLLENVGARILFFTDTQYEKLENVEVVLVNDEAREWNAAALDLEVKQLGNGAFSFTGKVASYGRDETLNVVLYVDGQYVQAKKIDCVAGEVTEVAFREYEAVNYQDAEIRIEMGDGKDALLYDDKYMTYREDASRLRVQVVFAESAYDEFLTIALSAAEINSQVVRITDVNEDGCENRVAPGGGLNPSKIKYSGYDAYIFVGILPEYMPGDGTTWLMNPPSETEKHNEKLAEFGLEMKVGEKKEDANKVGYSLMPVISANDEAYSLLKGLTFINKDAVNEKDNAVKVLSYNAITEIPPENELAADLYQYKNILSCNNDGNYETVMMIGKNIRTHTRIIVSTMVSSSLNANLEYTLLVNNFIRGYASPTVFTGGKTEVGEVGDSVSVTLPAGTIGYEVIKDGITIALEGKKEYGATSNTVAKDTSFTYNEPGDYTIRLHVVYTDEFGEVAEQKEMDYKRYIALAETESNSFRTLPDLSATIPEEGIPALVLVEIWLYLLIALMVVLMAEWLVYHHA